MLVELLVASLFFGSAPAVSAGEAIVERFPKRDFAMFREHRAAFAKRLPAGSVAILRSSVETPYHSLHSVAFRQDPDFYYLTGFDEPDSACVLVAGDKPTFILFVRPRDKAREVWDGRRAGPEGAKSVYGADAAHPIEKFEDELEKLLKNVPRVYWGLGAEDAEFEKRLLKVVGKMSYDRSRNPTPVAEVADPRPILHEMRLVKDASEIALMRRACEITCAAHQATIRATKPGMFEYELQAITEHEFRRAGAARVGYLSIVGAGPNGTILHYNTNRARILAGDLILMDAGAEFEMYTADVTRTWPASGTFSEPQRKIYEAVLDAQKAAIGKVRPGATFLDVHNESLRRVTESLKRLGIVKGDLEEALREKRFTPFFMHGTSHWIGLDVHDRGRSKIGDDSRVLQPGMILTVEPGVYISDDADDVDAKWRGIGVRIEDVILVTKDGHENFSAACPKEADEIERLMRKR